MSKFAVEESDRDLKKYKKVHAAGCRDLRDPEKFSADSMESLAYKAAGFAVIEDESELDELHAALAPCAAKLIEAF